MAEGRVVVELSEDDRELVRELVRHNRALEARVAKMETLLLEVSRGVSKVLHQ